MKDFFTLKLLDRFEPLFNRFGVDYELMRKILQIKLTMDQRRVPTIFSQQRSKQNKKDSNGYIKSLWIYILFGLFIIPFIIMGDNYLFQMSIVFGILMFLVMTSMISDFSSVLLDIRDQNILFTKPINKKTIHAAKAVHIFIYLTLLTLSIIGIPLIVGLVKVGVLFFLTMIVCVILINIFIVVITALLYLFVLQFFDGEKLKDIINYVQIALSLSVMIGYQVLVRSFELVHIQYVFDPQWWHVFISPIWFAAIIEIIMKGEFTPFYSVLALCGIVIPILAFSIYIRLMPLFEKNLQKLAKTIAGKQKRRSKVRELLLKCICFTKEERTFFRLAGLMMKNERDFKLKVYPSLGFSLVIPFIFLLTSFQTDEGIDFSTSKSYFTIYFSLIIIPTVLYMLRFSGKYRGAWIYSITPLKELYPVFSGTVKAFIVKLFLPLYMLLSVIFVLLFGMRIWPDLLVVFINGCIYAVICFLCMKKALPFSESFDSINQNNNWQIFVLILIVPLLAGLHYFISKILFGTYLYLAVVIIALAVLWKIAFSVSWRKMRES